MNRNLLIPAAAAAVAAGAAIAAVCVSVRNIRFAEEQQKLATARAAQVVALTTEKAQIAQNLAKSERDLERANGELLRGREAWNLWGYTGEDLKRTLDWCALPLTLVKQGEKDEGEMRTPETVQNVSGRYELDARDLKLIDFLTLRPGVVFDEKLTGLGAKGLKADSKYPFKEILQTPRAVFNLERTPATFGFDRLVVNADPVEGKPGHWKAVGVIGTCYCKTAAEAAAQAQAVLGRLVADGVRCLPIGAIGATKGKWALDTRRAFAFLSLDNFKMPDGSERHLVMMVLKDKQVQ